MIIFVNDTVVIGNDCEQIWRNPGSMEIPQYRGEVFTKDEVKYMMADLLNLSDLNKRLLERKSRDGLIITAYIGDCSFMPENDFAICQSNISTRTIPQRILQQFLDNIPVILRWL